MKMITLLTLVITMSSNLKAQTECRTRKIESTGNTIVYPIYKTTLLYTFDSYEKKAFAQINWEFDRQSTSLCVKKTLDENATLKIKIPGPNMPVIEFSVKGGLKTGAMIAYPELGGQFHGNTDLIPVDYLMKKEIINSINKKESLLSSSTPLKFKIEEVNREVISEFKCSQGGIKKGILALHSRLSDLLEKIKTLPSKERVDTDSVLENFLGSCVSIKEEESRDFKGLSRKATLLDSTLPIYGDQIFYSTENVSPIQTVESSYLEF